MKKLVKIGSPLVVLAILIASAVMSGCNKNVDPTPTPSKVPVAINAGIDMIAQTMASGIRDTQFNEADEIGIYVVAYLKPTVEGKLEIDGNYVDNAKSTKGVSSWTNAPVIYYPTVKVDMYAYYPFSAVFTPTATADKYLFNVAADQSTAVKVSKNDFMTAQVLGQVTTPSAIPMTFFHRLSKLDVQFTIPATFKGKAITSLKSVKFKSFKDGAIVDLITRYTYSADGLTTTGGIYPKPAVVDPTSTLIDIQPNVVAAGTIGSVAAHYEAIVVPQTQVKECGFVEIVVGYADSKTEQFNYVATQNIEFKAAHSTVVKLQFQPDNTILLGAVDIKGWEVTPPAAGDAVETEVFNDFTFNLTSASVAPVASVEMTVSQGTGTAVQTIYTIPAKHTGGSAAVNFSFDGTVASPEYYPFMIKKITCKDAAGSVIEEKTFDKEITAAGAISLP